MTSSDNSVEISHEEILALKNRVEKLEQENQDLPEENKRLRAKLRWHEGPHTPSSQKQSDSEESSSSSSDEDDEEPRTDGGTPGRKSGHDPEWRSVPDPDEEVGFMCDCCPDCGEQFNESRADALRLVEEIPDPQPVETTQDNRHYYECDSCGTETVASHPDCPDEGQFGVNVIAQAALSRYDHRLLYRQIADRFNQLHSTD